MDSGSSASEDDRDEQYKVTVLGNGGVGKTSLIQRYCQQNFEQNYKQTIGLDFYSKKVHFPGKKEEINLQIWDIGGQQLGGKMLENYVHGSDALMFIFDVTNVDSFKDLEDWYNSVIKFCRKSDSSELPYMAIVGNKIDLPNRQVTDAMIASFLSQHEGVDRFLVSARSSEKVRILFSQMAADLSGVTVYQEDLEMGDFVKANVMSNRTERAEALRHAVLTRDDNSAEGTKRDTCILM